MNNICQYYNGICSLMNLFNINVRSLNWCKVRCGKTDLYKIKMLNKFGIELPPSPKGTDLLDWAKEKIESGEVKMKKKPCGNCKNILIGFTKLAKIKLLNDEVPEYAVDRMEKCVTCDKRTWLNPFEWGVAKVSKETELPINHKKDAYDVLWCSVCTCCVMAAVLVPEKDCLLNKWPEIESG